MSVESCGVTVRPFLGLVPPAELASEVASQPYDVIDSSEARLIAKGNEKSFLRVNKPQIDLDDSIHIYDDRVYEKGRSNLEMFIRNGWLIRESQPAMYIYSQTMDDRTQFGLVCETSALEYGRGLIKKHELTRAKKEHDRTKLTDIQSANIGPIFLCYKPQSQIDEIINEIISNEEEHPPYARFKADDNVEHCLWKILDIKCIDRIQSLFASKVDALYVADGHHRTASAWNVAQIRSDYHSIELKKPVNGDEDFNFFLSVLFPSNQLRILDYNRYVTDLAGMTPEEFLKALEKDWEICPLHIQEGDDSVKSGSSESIESGSESSGSRKSSSLTSSIMIPMCQQTYDYRMYLCCKGWFTLKPKKHVLREVEDHPIKSLDVSILTDFLLTPLLKIGDLRSDERIHFIGGVRGLSELQRRVDSNANGVAFGLYPTSMSQVMRIADENLIMPPKSTWFEPKLRSGLVVRTFRTREEY